MKSKTKTHAHAQNCAGVSLIELCRAGRYREARECAVDVSGETPVEMLGLAVTEIYRGALATAKDLLSKLAFGESECAGLAKIYLAHAYYLAGELAEAKDLLKSAPDDFEKFLLKAVMEDRPKYALRLLDKAAVFRVRPGMQGRLHNQRAMILRRLKESDRAIQEYEAALYFFEQDESDCVALVVNNLARVYLEAGQHDLAVSHVERAIKMLKDDPPHLGKALDEKARILLAQGQIEQAKKSSFEAVLALRRSDRKEWLIEALLTHAYALRAAHDERELAAIDEAEANCRYLDRADLLVDVLKVRTEFAQASLQRTERRLLETALIAFDGSYRKMAERILNSPHHEEIRRLLKRHDLDKNFLVSKS